MRRITAHIGVGALVLGGVTLGLAPSASAGEDHPPDGDGGPVVVVTGLDNPRQLSWAPDDTLLIAEAGSGGDTCVTPPAGEAPAEAGPLCAGTTGGVSAVHDPDDVTGSLASRVVDELFSVAGPDGSFAGGSTGADATDLPGEYIVVENASAGAPLPAELAALPGSEQFGHLLVVETEADEQVVFPYADIVAAETAQNPDGAQIESNPYATLFVDPTPEDETGVDGYALVADAAANTVWKVEPDFSAVPADCVDAACIPPYEITVFATYPTTAEDEVTPEFVPTALATDAAGNVYVGGLGADLTGEAAVVEYTAAGEETDRWGGFTGITGLAVDAEGEHLYVSQLFGTLPDEAAMAPPGNVVRVDLAGGTYQSVDVPFPAGVAVDERGRVYVSAFSVSPAEGVPASELGPALPGGQLWRISFEEQESIGLPVSFPLDTGGEFVPAQPFVQPFPGVCGTGLFLAPGDIDGEWRVTRNAEGDRIEHRGAATADVLGPDGSVLLDELDVSGAGFEFYSADGAAEFSFEAPNVLFAFPEEEAAFAEAGLPPNFYYTQGTFHETIDAEGEVTLLSTPTDAVDLCSLLPAG